MSGVILNNANDSKILAPFDNVLFEISNNDIEILYSPVS